MRSYLCACRLIAGKALIVFCAALLSVTLGSCASFAKPAYSGIVIDATTGKTLYEANADSYRYPASLTKMMTLYITFEALASGKVRKTTQIPVSAFAASRPPSKLGLKAGQTISVETAIYALVTKSANDASSALGEYFGGSEEGFGRIMTSKARALGMSHTTFRNPHGLPDPRQMTTARDMARLGLALKAHFPQYYSYFSTRAFSYGKRRMPNHNKLLGRVKGVDGIKTGYTRASGFNLVSSVQRGNKRIVAVVIGGKSGRARDRQMAGLIEKYLPASSSRSGLMQIARGRAAPVGTGADEQVAAKNDDVTTPRFAAKASVLPTVRPSKPVEVKPVKLEEPDVDPVKTASVAPARGWMIQVASATSRKEAMNVLSETSRKAGRVLASVKPYTEEFEKNGVTYHRARFAGFSGKDAAWRACAALKKQKISCYAVQN